MKLSYFFLPNDVFLLFKFSLMYPQKGFLKESVETLLQLERLGAVS